jgi:hypothetical protein
MSGAHNKGKKRGPQKAWTEDEDAYLRENAGKETAESIGVALGASKMQVQVRCNALGLQWRVRGGMKAAKQAGEDFFVSTFPCKRGHRALRRASNGMCCACEKMRPPNPQVSCQYYRARKREATPAVLSIQERRLIWNFYKEARRLTVETGIKYEVDHIMPLSKGGLHAPSNLQVITAEENRKKAAKIPMHLQEAGL